MNIQMPVIQTKSGQVRGSIEKSTEGENYYAFKGIPYGKPPMGQLRFADPEPVEPWVGIKDVVKYGSPCAQSFLSAQPCGSDDCLYLNLFAKSIESEPQRPVMIFIYGGGFISGEGNDWLYGPDFFMRKDIILITFNYRIGVLGFLNLEDEIAPGNQGLKDQVLALKWVRDNISNFGGDPNNVTVFGESAGGVSVHYLCLSQLAKGLFHKAICQSGVGLMPGAYIENPKRFAYELCALLGKNTKNHKEIVDFLRSIDCLQLADAQSRLINNEESVQGIFPFGPGVDVKSKSPFMPVHPIVAAREGIQVPLIIGYNNREAIFSIKKYREYIESFEENFDQYLHPNAKEWIRKKYDLTTNDIKRLYFKCDTITLENIETLIDLMTDIKYVEGIHSVVKIQLEKSSFPTYLYQYTYDKELSFFKTLVNASMRGACHVDELQHLFTAKMYSTKFFKPLAKGSCSYRLMEQMVELWVNFATYGKPTLKKTDLIPVIWEPLNNSLAFNYLNICEDLRMALTINIEEILHVHRKWNK